MVVYTAKSIIELGEKVLIFESCLFEKSSPRSTRHFPYNRCKPGQSYLPI